MMIRRYIVKDMPEAVVHIRRELGKDAVILSSKRITLKQWLGLWRYKRLEVVAATGVRPPLVHQLIRQGLNEEHVSRLMESFTATRTPVGGEGTGEPWTSGKQHDLFVQHVLRDMEAQVEAQPIAPTSRVVALVGPTGVGKSTTIAKLAALHVLAGESESRITHDGYISDSGCRPTEDVRRYLEHSTGGCLQDQRHSWCFGAVGGQGFDPVGYRRS